MSELYLEVPQILGTHFDFWLAQLMMAVYLGLQDWLTDNRRSFCLPVKYHSVIFPAEQCLWV